MLGRLDEVAKIIGIHAGEKKGIGAPFFADERYDAVPFSASNFKAIKPSHQDAGRKIAFIDAGNMEIFSSPGLSVHFIRAYFCIFEQSSKSLERSDRMFKDNARVLPRKLPAKLEFFSVATAGAKGGVIQFSSKLIPAGNAPEAMISEMGGITLDASEPTISRAGGMGASISVMGSVARRFAEWLYAAKIIESELDAGDILVRDGALISSVKGEAEFAKKAYDAAEKRKVILCACAKTSELLTTTGMPLTSSLQILAEKNKIAAPWFYHPIAENNNLNHRAEIFVCNLHEKTRRAFRFEIEKNCAANLSGEETANVFGAIAANSRDGAFLGYPYGLIDVDLNSRISFKEGANWRGVLLSLLKKRGATNVELLENAVDAHEVLNGSAMNS